MNITSRDRRNAVADIAGEAAWGFQTGLVASGTVLVIILRQFGAGATTISSITSIEMCGTLLPQVLGLGIFRTRSNRKRDLILYHLVAIIPFLFIMAAVLQASPHLSPVTVRIGMLAGWGLFMGAIGVIMAPWLDWLAQVFDVGIRGTVMGIAFCASSAAGTIGGLISGRIIRDGHDAHVYAVLYFVAAIFAMISVGLFWFVSDPAESGADTPKVSLDALLAHFKNSLTDSNFRAFLIGRILATTGFCVLPLVANYFASPGGGSIGPGRLVSCGAAMTVGTAVANLGLGRLGDKRGHWAGLLIGVVGQIVALILLLTARGQAACIAVYFTAGICIGSAFISHFNMIFETCPHENRTAHITIANVVIGACTVTTPILAGMAAARWGMRLAFEVSLAVSIIALAWFVMRVREPREIGTA